MKITREINLLSDKKALTPREVSFLFGLAEGTLANWRNKRIGPRYFKPGGRKIVYLHDDVLAWIKRHPYLTDEGGTP